MLLILYQNFGLFWEYKSLLNFWNSIGINIVVVVVAVVVVAVFNAHTTHAAFIRTLIFFFAVIKNNQKCQNKKC